METSPTIETNSLFNVIKSGILSNLHFIIPTILLLGIIIYLLVQSNCNSNGEWDLYTMGCVCNPGYTGHSCASKTPDHVTCLENKGTWESGVCKCKANMYGKTCSKYCLNSETCGGNGKCSTEGTCLCTSSFTGIDCKTPVTCPLGSFIKEPCNGYSVGSCVDGRCRCRAKNIVSAGATNCDFTGAESLRLFLNTFASLAYYLVIKKCKFAKALPESEIVKGVVDKTKVMERIFLAITKLAISDGLHHRIDKEYFKELFTRVCAQEAVEERKHPTMDMHNSKEECLPESRWNEKYKVCCEKGSVPKEEKSSNSKGESSNSKEENEVHCYWSETT